MNSVSVVRTTPMEVSRASEQVAGDCSSVRPGWVLAAIGILPMGILPFVVSPVLEGSGPVMVPPAALNRHIDAAATWREAIKHAAPLSPRAPRTALGRKLLAIREKIVASGQPLRTWDEVETEAAERRAERERDA